MVYVHLQNWYSSLFLSCKDICLNLVLSRITLAIMPCKTSFPAWRWNQILLVRKSFVTKDKENTRYWFFTVWKILPPDVWTSEGCFVQIPASWVQIVLKCSTQVSDVSKCPWVAEEGNVEASKWSALFWIISHCSRVIVIALSGLSVWAVTVPLLFLLGTGRG